MKFLSVRGPSQLSGMVCISGAKNSVLPILAATLLCNGKCQIHNCPKIDDVEHTLSILRDFGASVTYKAHTVTIDTTAADGIAVAAEEAVKMRASIVFLGALLARNGVAKLSLPGGCPLGKRPIDMHLRALAALGVQFLLKDDRLYARAPHPQANTVRLPYPSVGATENVLLFSMSVCGTVILQNAAKEPEIVDLARFLSAAGADISGAGTDTIVIRGQKPLHGISYTVMPDRIEAATYLCACAGCGGRITLKNTNPDDLLPVLSVLQEGGCEIQTQDDAITIASEVRLHMPRKIETAPHPGFPTDAQALCMAAFLRAQGSGRWIETVFENRFSHVHEFQKMGAQIALRDQTALVTGVERLQGAMVCATDLRAAAALLIAAMQAEGESCIFALHHLYRGYENPVHKFNNLACSVKTVEIPMEIVYNTNE